MPELITGPLLMLYVAAFAMGWQPWCCCDPPIQCFECAYCEGECASEEFEVVVAGIVNGTCSACAGLNGTYTLTFNHIIVPPPGGCRWDYIVSATGWPCASGTLFPAGLRLDLVSDGSPGDPANFFWRLIILEGGNSLFGYTFQTAATPSDPPTCTEIDMPIPYIGSDTTRCNAASASVDILAIV